MTRGLARGHGRPVAGFVHRARIMNRPVRASVALSLLGAVAGCGLLRGAPEARSLSVDLPVTRSEAVRRTLTAFREQGYTIRASLTSGLNPQTEPFRQGEAEAVFRAEISGSESRARVVLSGTYRIKQFGGIVRTDEKVIRNSDDATERALWSRLDQLRLAIREP